MTSSKAKHSAEFQAKLDEMRRPIVALAQLTTGQVSPDFPRTKLAFYILTSAQLDGLARFYHQDEQSLWTFAYPRLTRWSRGGVPLSLDEKRVEMAHFVGLGSRIRTMSEEEIWEQVRKIKPPKEKEEKEKEKEGEEKEGEEKEEKGEESGE
ncbi:hypothetical protein PVAG01_05287 [Phlyctema vagabunda]|uniref:Uncharacterized protein n=1 Tax=Phlyctema vagabunda TaxID=108571 RepID=A0ABR4PJN4_9HELO